MFIAIGSHAFALAADTTYIALHWLGTQYLLQSETASKYLHTYCSFPFADQCLAIVAHHILSC